MSLYCAICAEPIVAGSLTSDGLCHRACRVVNERNCYVCGGVDEQAPDGMWACSNCGATHGPTPVPVKETTT